MDALYDVLGVNESRSRARVDQKLRSLRATLNDYAFFADDELAPVLLAIALTECRLAGCSMKGIGLLVAKVYGKNLQLRELETEVVGGKVQIQVPPEPPPAQGLSGEYQGYRAPEPNAPTTPAASHDLLADDMVGRVLQIFGTRGFDFSMMPQPDLIDLQDALRSAFHSMLGKKGVH